MTPKEKAPAAPTTEALKESSTDSTTEHSTKQAAEKILGAVILQPYLAASIPLTIHARFSCYGLFVVKACAEGWGIEGIRHALDSFGLDGAGIVNTALNSVRGDPASIFWESARKLCEKVAA